MNKAVPWNIKGVDSDTREAAREAARRSGMSVGEWLNSVIADQAAAAGRDSAAWISAQGRVSGGYAASCEPVCPLARRCAPRFAEAG